MELIHIVVEPLKKDPKEPKSTRLALGSLDGSKGLRALPRRPVFGGSGRRYRLVSVGLEGVWDSSDGLDVFHAKFAATLESQAYESHYIILHHTTYSI